MVITAVMIVIVMKVVVKKKAMKAMMMMNKTGVGLMNLCLVVMQVMTSKSVYAYMQI